MNTETFLLSYLEAKKKMDRLKEMKKDLYDAALDSTSVDIATINGERHIVPKVHGGIKKQKKVENIAIRLSEIDDEIERSADDKAKAFIKVVGVIEKIDSGDPIMNEQFRNELYLHYIKGIRWEEIAEVIGYSERAIYKHRIKMLECVERAIENGIQD